MRAKTDGQQPRPNANANGRGLETSPTVLEIPRANLPTDRTLVMGIVNLTPDSFSDGGKWNDRDRALARAEQLRAEGADLIDVGAESTRPGSERISPTEEQQRLGTVVSELVKEGHVVSVDTINATTAAASVEAGAHIINDISGAQWDRQMARTMAQSGAAVIIQHWRGMPGSDSEQPLTQRVVPTLIEELRGQVSHVLDAGVKPERIIIDPGLGFGKDADASWEILAGLGRIRAELPWPILIGASRKRMVRAVAGPQASIAQLDGIATGISVMCANEGVWAVRVHEALSHALAMQAVRAWKMQR
ncbi:MAG: dihydropteroate synthase [Actinomycetaceae bacterium]|nr:dihydropteroate synthase [Actinomycetaceae bacterium]